MKLRVSEYIAQRCVEFGIEQVFMVTGGGAMYLNDALGGAPGLKVLFNHHEQAAAMAAEGYARIKGKPAIVNVTSGPGGINAMNGVFGAYTDSVPMVVISGQVRYDTTAHAAGIPFRQLGDQEFPGTITCAATMSKYAVLITEPQSIRYHLEKALHLATSGRPGPVWLDVPVNIQGAMVDTDTMPAYDPAEDTVAHPPIPDATLDEVVRLLRAAKRPVLMLGSGVRLAGAEQQMRRLLEQLRIPVVLGFNAHDLLGDDHPLNCGSPGSIGNRPGNFTVQSADVLLTVGTRLNIRQISYNWKSFARHAKKIVVDIDPLEFQKPTIQPDLPVLADAQDFFTALTARLLDEPLAAPDWLAWCQARKAKYPAVLPEYSARQAPINPYAFTDVLGHVLPADAIIATGNATVCICTFQALRIKDGQRLFSNSGSASMGYDLPAAIGAACGARPGQTVVCLAGDGSIQMNLQELQTIVTNRLPVKVMLYNNNGYLSIKLTQTNHFNRHFVGSGPGSGVDFPEMRKLAAAFGLPYLRIESLDQAADVLARTIAMPGPVICEVMLDAEQAFAPRISSRRLEDGSLVSAPLEDMFPFLDRDELAQNMIAPDQD